MITQQMINDVLEAEATFGLDELELFTVEHRVRLRSASGKMLNKAGTRVIHWRVAEKNSEGKRRLQFSPNAEFSPSWSCQPDFLNTPGALMERRAQEYLSDFLDALRSKLNERGWFDAKTAQEVACTELHARWG